MTTISPKAPTQRASERVEKGRKVLPDPSPLKMPHQNLALSPKVIRVWELLWAPSRAIQSVYYKLRKPDHREEMT